MKKLILFNKPFNVLSQFEDLTGRKTLKDFIPIPEIYPAGRLDYNSEGLMLLTNDGKLQQQISNPKHKIEKTYWVQVENIPDDSALKILRNGLKLKGIQYKPAKVKRIPEPQIWPRHPPIRERKSIPTCWLEIKIREGKNRQVRKMTAAIKHPTLRLIRVKIGHWELGDLKPGQWINHKP